MPRPTPPDTLMRGGALHPGERRCVRCNGRIGDTERCRLVHEDRADRDLLDLHEPIDIALYRQFSHYIEHSVALQGGGLLLALRCQVVLVVASPSPLVGERLFSIMLGVDLQGIVPREGQFLAGLPPA